MQPFRKVSLQGDRAFEEKSLQSKGTLILLAPNNPVKGTSRAVVSDRLFRGLSGGLQI
jgi:hypothetical protein